MPFKLIGRISEVEVVAAGPGVRVRALLNRMYGKARWRKMKGTATVRLPNASIRKVELHWYEAHGMGKRDLKIKRYLEAS
jgi:hypothetical protein